MNKIKVGVTGLGSLIGQAIIKSIAKSCFKRDVDIIGFDYFESTVGSYWVNKSYILPDLLKKEVSPQQWLEDVIRCIKEEDLRVIFIGLDFELKVFAEYKNIIESDTKCKIMVSSSKVIEIADDKYLTYNFLKNNGLAYPNTFLKKDLDLDTIDFPCIIKPRRGFRSRDVFIVHDGEELCQRLKQINEPIIQQLIGRASSEYTSGVICLDNNIKEIIVLRRDLKDGNTIAAYFDKDINKVIYDYVYDVSSKLNPYGVCNFQLRLDEHNVPKIFEINARHSGTTYIRSMFGFNEIEYILSYILGFKPKKFKLKEGVVKRYYEEMFLKAGSKL